MLNFVQITGTFQDDGQSPLSGTAVFAPNTAVYAPGAPVLTPDNPIQAQITSGQLRSASGGNFQLLATDNSGLSFLGQTGFLSYTVTVTLNNEVLPSWEFTLPHATWGNGPVDLYALANTPASGGGITPPAGDIGGTTSAPTVVSTHLSAPLPVAQGGTGQALASSALSALGGAAVAGDLGGTSASPQVTGTHLAVPLPLVQGGTGQNAGSAAALLTSLGAAALAGAAFTGEVTAQAPVNPSDVATKAYADAIAQGLAVKPSVQEATATALPANTYSNGASGVGATLTATANGALTVDGITVSAGDRVLVQYEATAANNGLYAVTQTGSGSVPYILTRTSDMNTPAQIPGAFVFTEQGTANAGAGFTVASKGPFTLGTTAISWTQFSGAGEITTGTGLTKSGNQIALVTPVAIANGGTGTATAPQNDIFAGPVSGGAGAPSFRTLQLADLPVTGTPAAGGSIAITGPSTAKFYVAPYRFVVGADAAAQYLAAGDGSTDDTSAFTNAIAAAASYAVAHGGVGLVDLEPPGAYYAINGPLVNAGNTSGSKTNAQIPLPLIATGGNKIRLVIRGLIPGQSWPMWNQTSTPWGGIPLVSNGVFANGSAQGTSLNTWGDACVLGGPNPTTGFGTSSAVYNNMTVVLDSIAILVPVSTAGLAYCAADLSGTSQAHLRDCAYGANTTYANTWASQSVGGSNFSRGLIMPAPGNNDLCVLENVTCYGGFTYGALLTEHCDVYALRVLYCWAGLCPTGSFGGSGAVHAIKVHQASVEDCNQHIYVVGQGAGGLTYMDIDQLDWEGGALNLYDNSSGAGLASLRGTINVAGYIPSGVNILGSPYTGPSQLGAKLVFQSQQRGIVTAPSFASGTPVVNPYWYDVQVFFSGGSITAVALDGTVTGLATSGSIVWPSGSTLAFTYTGTPVFKARTM